MFHRIRVSHNARAACCARFSSASSVRLLVGLVVGAFALPCAAVAEQVLVVASTNSTHALAADGLVPLLTAAGHTVTRVTALPASLAGYDQVWDVSASYAISTDEQATYVAYLQSGKRAFIMGENTSYGAARNASLVTMIATLGGGSLTIAGGTNTQTIASPWNVDATSLSYPAAGVFQSRGTGTYITYDPALPNAGSALAFSPGTLSAARTATFAVVLDVNFLQPSYQTSNAGCRALANSLVGYVGGTIVESLSVTSVSGPANGSYKAAANLDFTTTLSAAATVTGTPRLAVTVGSTTRYATYVSGSGTKSLVFRYTVQSGDNDSDGIAVTSPIDLNAGTIKDSNGTDATLTFTAPNLASVLVDTTAPAVPSAPATASNPTNNTTPALTGTADAGATITVFDGSTSLGTTVATGGSWSFTPGSALSNGTHVITATATDVAGNSSVASAALSLVVDTTAPSVTSGSTAAGTYGSASFSYAITATDANGIATYTAAGLPTGLSLNAATGAISGTPLQSGTFNVTVGATDAAGNSGTKALTLTVARASVAVTGLSAASRPYDGTVTAQLSGSATLVGILPADVSNVALAGTAAGAFGDAHVGTGKTVTITGLSLTGTAAANYSLSALATSASITAKSVTANVGIADKVYDAGTTASISTRSLSGTVGSDSVSLTGGSATFASSDVGSGKTVSVTGLSLTGAAASDYVLASSSATGTAAITARPITVTATAGLTKVYGTSDPALAYTVTSGSLAGTDALAGSLTRAAGENVGTYAIAQGTLTAGANYNLTFVPADFAVTAKSLTASVTVSDKVYDGSVSATITTRSVNGTLGADEVSLTGGTAAFDTKQAGPGKTVTVSGLTLGGAAAGNYALASSTVTTVATITPKAITAGGITAANKTYDGTTTATLSGTGAALSGTIVNDDVTLVTAGMTGTFASADAGAGKPVTITGVTLGGADAANYSLTAPSATATISPAPATVTLGNLSQIFDGQQRTVSATTVPTSLPVTISYAGSAAAPTSAGSYTVTATVADPNYTGSASGTLTVAKASQTITFNAGTPVLGQPLALSATASSGLPVTFSIVSGNATLNGGNLTMLGAGAVVVRATQVGSSNVSAATADRTFTIAGKLNQTISFAALSDRLSNSGSFPLDATASSGLPVTFTIVSGPAMLSDATVTLTGVAGVVTVKATQPGNDTYNPAPDVVVSFQVSAAAVKVYFGVVTNGSNNTKAGDVAATLPPDSRQGSLLVVAPGIGLNAALTFTLNPDGTFVQTFENAATATVTGGTEPARAAAAATLTARGSLVNGRLSGVIEPLGVSFSADVLPVTGSSAAAAGFYASSSLATATGTTYSIVGTNNEILVLAQTPTLATGGRTTLDTAGSFNLQTSTDAGLARISGSVDEPSTTVNGTISLPGKPDTNFAGLIVSASRTDRLVNLSSRVRVGGGERVLITGFVIGGTASKQVLIRGIGPGLAGFGVGGVLSNPKIRVYRGTEVVAENDEWSTAANASALASATARIGAFTLNDKSSDAALLATLAPGAYSVQVLDNGGTGVALAEIYDASENPNSEYQRLINISTRGEAGAGENVLIGGFVVTGNAPKKLLVRGIGPGLTAFGVSGALTDPKLRVFSGATVLAENDNWSAVAADATTLSEAGRTTGAFALPAGSKDAAVVVTLAPGAYTAQVSSVDGQVGVALVEIYEIPEN